MWGVRDTFPASIQYTQHDGRKPAGKAASDVLRQCGAGVRTAPS